MPESENGAARNIALGTIDVTRPGRSSLPPHAPAVILVHAGDVSVGRVEIRNAESVTPSAIAARLSHSLAERTLRAGVSALVAQGIPEYPVGVERALMALAEAPTSPAQLPTVTVAICTRDRERQLARAIASVTHSLGPGDELVVVDNASTADLSTFTRQFPEARLVRENRPGLDWARNRAIVESKGEVIAFCDDDCVMLPTTLPALRRAFARNPDVGAVTGLVEPLTLDTEAQALCDAYLASDQWYPRQWITAPRSSTIARDVGNVGRYGTGASLAVRRRLFDRIGVFDAALGAGSQCRAGDDMEFFFRLLKSGAMLLREPRVSVRHDHRLELSELEAQFEAWSGGFACAAQRSMIAFPEERVPYTVLLARIAVGYHARRALQDSRLRPIALAELRGMFGARQRYVDSRQAAERLARTVPSPALDAHPGQAANLRTRQSGGVEQHSLDLARAPIPLRVGPGGRGLTITLAHHGRSLGTLSLDAIDGWIGADRLCDAIASSFGPVLLGTSWPVAVTEARAILDRRLRAERT